MSKVVEKSLQLNIPREWNELSDEQIEKISKIFIEHSKKFTNTGHFDDIQLLIEVFFVMTGLEVIGLPHHTEIDDEDYAHRLIAHVTDIESTQKIYYEAQFVDENIRKMRQYSNGEIRPIRIFLSDIMSLAIGHYDIKEVKKYAKAVAEYEQAREKAIELKKGCTMDPPSPVVYQGPISWVLKPCTLTRFPYSTISLRDPNSSADNPVMETFEGPNMYMDGWSWRQYRFTNEMMQMLPAMENQYLQMKKNSLNYGSTMIAQMEEAIDDQRSRILANIFNRSIPHINPETGTQETSYFYVSSQCIDNAQFFKHFPEEKFQAIWFWWQGMMLYLQRSFPKVFRKSKLDKGNVNDDPLKLYTRSTTTMIKYSGNNEEEVNKTTYTVILEHINDMAEQNDRLNEIKSK